MLGILLRVLLPLLLIGCHKFSNTINKLEHDCGETGDLNAYRYAKLFSETDAIFHSNDIQVSNEAGENLNSMVTSKGCLKIPMSLTEKLIVARPSTNEGLVFYPERLTLNSINPMQFKIYRYQSITPLCKNALATAESAIKWPVNLQTVDVPGFQWTLSIKQKNEIKLQLEKSASDELSRELVNISELQDGRYDLEVRARQLFSTDKLESKFNCELIVDRTSPFVLLDRSPVDTGEVGQKSLQAAPGEAIRILSSNDGSEESLFSCILPLGKPASDCKYDQLSGGFLTAPQAGDWMLRIFSRDAAGNSGPMIELPLQIFDSNVISIINAYIEQSSLAQNGGAGLTAMVAATKAYEKMQNLASKVEVNSVFPRVRKAVLESFSMSIEENSIKLEQNKSVETLGIVNQAGKTLHVYLNAKGDYDLLETTGRVHATLDLPLALGVARNLIKTNYCRAEGTILAHSDKVVLIFLNGTLARRLELDRKTDPRASPVFSTDCRYAFITLAASGMEAAQVVGIDLRSFEIFPFNSPLGISIVGSIKIAGLEKFVMFGSGGTYQVHDKTDKSIVPLSEILGITDIDQVKMARDGSLGVLTQNKSLHILSNDGQSIAVKKDVIFFDKSTLPSEFVAIISSNQIAAYSTKDGSLTAGFDPGYKASWSYLDANEEFIVAMTLGSNLVKIWTRNGSNYDEIYNKADRTNDIWLSKDGYLGVRSYEYLKLYKLNNQLSQKIVPNRRLALGLQFSTDGQHLMFKEQIWPYMYEVTHNNLVDWNIATNAITRHSLPSIAPSEYLPVPSDPMRTRDLAYFTKEGVQYLVSTVKRGTVAIYRAESLEAPIKEFEISTHWLHDIAVDSTGTLLVGLTGNGLVYVLNLESGILGSYNHYTYGINIEYDKTNDFLFVTDSYGDLIKLKIGYDTAMSQYKLDQVAEVYDSGATIALNPSKDRIAAVGFGGKLNLYDENLKPITQFELSSSSVKLGQSVVFSADGTKIFAGVYDGTWNEVNLKTRQVLKVKFSASQAGAINLAVAPAGDRLAFVGGGFVHLIDLNIDRVYKNICTWLKPRLPYIPDLSEDDKKLCGSTR